MQATCKPYALADIEHMKVHGRTTAKRSPLTLYWTGSGIELNVQGSEVWVELESADGVYEQWITVAVNGFVLIRQMVPAGRSRICLFRGMDGSKVKNVRLTKEVQPMAGDAANLLQIHAIHTDGVFHPVPDRPRKLEFVGDSITSGEGVAGAQSEEDWLPMFFSTVDHYAALTAEALEADYRIVAQSGWGVLTSWDNNPHLNLPRIYGQICGVAAGEQAEDALAEHDFAAWQPDAVIVNLGTNDASAFHQPAWIDEATGETFKMRLAEDGSFHADDLAKFEQAVADFLAKLRACNPEAYLVWAYGMLGAPLLPAIRRAVDRYGRQTGDGRVAVCELPDMTAETAGARQHPGTKAHRQAAAVLTAFLRERLDGEE